MAKHGKKYQESAKLIEAGKVYDPEEAIALIQKMPSVKFDATLEVSVKLGVDPKHADQQVRGAVVLPNGTGKTKRVLVFAKGEKAKEAELAGADFVGAEDMVEKIQGGWTDFDVAVATPDMMGTVGRLGKILGPKGLMPNPKVGTVTMDVATGVKNAKAGQVQYRTDKGGIVHSTIGRASFEVEKLEQNLKALVDALVKGKPASSKGQYLKKIDVSSTMGPGVRVDSASL